MFLSVHYGKTHICVNGCIQKLKLVLLLETELKWWASDLFLSLGRHKGKVYAAMLFHCK